MPQIGVGTVVTRPSLRTVQVLFAHTALQSSVSMGEKVKMVQASIFAVGSSKRADRALHGRRPHEGAGYATGDIARFPNTDSVREPPCSLESHLTSCVAFPR